MSSKPPVSLLVKRHAAHDHRLTWSEDTGGEVKNPSYAADCIPFLKGEGRCSRTGQKDDGVRDRDHLDLCLAPIDEQFNPIDKTALI